MENRMNKNAETEWSELAVSWFKGNGGLRARILTDGILRREGINGA